jgi:hypothetical protein
MLQGYDLRFTVKGLTILSQQVILEKGAAAARKLDEARGSFISKHRHKKQKFPKR